MPVAPHGSGYDHGKTTFSSLLLCSALCVYVCAGAGLFFRRSLSPRSRTKIVNKTYVPLSPEQPTTPPTPDPLELGLIISKWIFQSISATPCWRLNCLRHWHALVMNSILRISLSPGLCLPYFRTILLWYTVRTGLSIWFCPGTGGNTPKTNFVSVLAEKKSTCIDVERDETLPRFRLRKNSDLSSRVKTVQWNQLLQCKSSISFSTRK